MNPNDQHAVAVAGRCAPSPARHLSLCACFVRLQPAADNPSLYRHLVERLAAVLDLRAQSDPQVGPAAHIMS